ncbi:MAG: energy-coupling factor ABC transporter permease [Desulfamplus sp.]|nr:energy-coupling factor ABC transporter permease [Desulfamplus sp.]
MHMADALISPAVGCTMWVVTASLIGYCSKKVKSEMYDEKVPLMGVLGAFIFAAQMINFTIPITGSSGHLGGGMILSILLGPHIAFLTMASVLTVQSLFFADGGLLALGCNIFNLGFFPCFIAYPLIYKNIVRKVHTQPYSHQNQQKKDKYILIGALIASIVGLQMGAFAVVLETLFSGISELPFGTFLLMMQPIHLAIGVVEGVTTAAVVIFIWKARPEILDSALSTSSLSNSKLNSNSKSLSIRNVVIGVALATILTGGVLSWFASSNPDGLEWAMFKTSGVEELKTQEGIHTSLSAIQEKIAFLPDYGFKSNELSESNKSSENPNLVDSDSNIVNAGTSVSGLVGGTLTLLFTVVIGVALKRRKSKITIS